MDFCGDGIWDDDGDSFAIDVDGGWGAWDRGRTLLMRDLLQGYQAANLYSVNQLGNVSWSTTVSRVRIFVVQSLMCPFAGRIHLHPRLLVDRYRHYHPHSHRRRPREWEIGKDV